MHATPSWWNVFAFDAIFAWVNPRRHRELYRSVIPRDVSEAVFYYDKLEGDRKRTYGVRTEGAWRSLGSARWNDFLPSEESGGFNGGEENPGRFNCAVEWFWKNFSCLLVAVKDGGRENGISFGLQSAFHKATFNYCPWHFFTFGNTLQFRICSNGWSFCLEDCILFSFNTRCESRITITECVKLRKKILRSVKLNSL